MSAVQIISELKKLSLEERQKIIDESSRLNEQESAQAEPPREVIRQRMEEAAVLLEAYYKPGGKLTEWNVLDGEEFR